MKMFLKDKKGMILIACYMVIVVLAILGSAFLVRSISESRIAEREKQSIQAFWLAEAGIMRSLDELRLNYDWPGTGNPVNIVPGQYQANVTAVNERRRILADGFIPNSATASAQRTVEVLVERKAMPDDFFDYALYITGDAIFNGNAYQVNGNVIYAGNIQGNTSNITGNIDGPDPSISPLTELAFSQLLQLSQQQGNVYDALRLQTDSLPNSFWFDQALGIPNIVYVQADLTLNGNVGTIGGFLIVVGDVINDPSTTQDTTINGNGQIDGCIYSTGQFRVNGGGGNLNVNGGAWAGIESRLNGNANITYNATYMNAISNLPLNPDIQILSWQEIP